MAALPETATVQLEALHLPPFDRWQYKDALAVVQAATPSWYAENFDFAELGDYWRKGAGWIGPTGSAAVKAATLTRIETQFTPVDAIGDALDNVESALLKREPRVDLVPVGLETENPDGTQTDAQKRAEEDAAREASELKDLIAVWWDRRMFHELLKMATRRARWAERSYLRLWVPPGMLEKRMIAGQQDGGPVLGAANLADALRKLYVEAVPAARALIYVDPVTQQRAGVVLYTQEEKQFAEVSWVDGEWTIIRILAESGTEGAPQEVRAKMNGRLPLIECSASLLITEAVRRQQKRLNYFESVLVRNVETAGFPERATINAEDEGEWEEVVGADPGPYAVQTINGKLYRLVPTARTLGAAITANLRGITQKDGTLTTPGLIRFEPVDPELTTKAADHAYQTLMRSCKQAHLANRGTSAAEASGLAYEQARAAFTADLENTKGPVEGLTRESLAALLAFAEHIAGKPGEFTERYRLVVELHVNAGPESPDSLRLAMEAGDKRFLSRENVMARLGVEDPQAEIARIAAESDGSLPLQDGTADVLVKLEQAAVLTPRMAATMMEQAGMPVEDAAKLAEEIRAAQAPAAGMPGSGLGTGGVPPIPGITG